MLQGETPSGAHPMLPLLMSSCTAPHTQGISDPSAPHGASGHRRAQKAAPILPLPLPLGLPCLHRTSPEPNSGACWWRCRDLSFHELHQKPHLQLDTCWPPKASHHLLKPRAFPHFQWTWGLLPPVALPPFSRLEAV